MASLMPQGKQQYFSNAGALLVGGKVYTYAAGTTTPLATYSDAAGTTPNTNPVILDSRGEASVFFATSSYKLVLKDASDATIWTQDNVSVANADSIIYTPAGTGAVATTVQTKLRESVSAMDFGAVVGVDMSTALQNAINALPALGGEIFIGPGAWVVNTIPTVGTKSIIWNVSPAATFSGTGIGVGKFLSAGTNPQSFPVGPFIQSQSTTPTPSLVGGIVAFTAEMLQPSTYNGSSVAIYAGASSSSSQAVADVWGLNTLVKALAGATGVFQSIEADVDTFAVGATTKGIGLNGVGDYNATVGIELARADATKWIKGIHILNALTGIQIEAAGLNIGLIINGPVVSQVAASLGQLANNGDTLLISRNTDTAPGGYYIRFVNAANAASLFSVDVAGNVNAAGNIVAAGGLQGGIVTGANFRATDAAVPASAGVLALGSATSTTATAGAQTLPANPAGFFQAYLGATLVKIPYYNS